MQPDPCLAVAAPAACGAVVLDAGCSGGTAPQYDFHWDLGGVCAAVPRAVAFTFAPVLAPVPVRGLCLVQGSGVPVSGASPAHLFAVWTAPRCGATHGGWR